MTTNRNTDEGGTVHAIDLRFDLMVDAELDLAFHEITYHLATLDAEGDILLTLEGI